MNTLFDQYRQWILNTTAIIAIICCMSFPIDIMDGYIFDLRLVALTVAGLYGGYKSVILLSIVTALFRLIIGGVGAEATLVVLSILVIMLISVLKYFHQAMLKMRLIMGALVAIFVAIIVIINSIFIYGTTFSAKFTLIYILISLLATVMIIYLKEIFQDSILISKRVIKAEKMEVVSHLASSVSHEVRNPLTVVRGFLQMMMEKDIPEEQKKKFLEISLYEIDRANEIIRDYLTFAKPSPENVSILNIKKEIERTLQIIQPLANMNGVDVDTRLDNYYINGDEQILQQCLINITKNCIEAMPQSGRLVIETKHIDHHTLIITISDTGMGMTKEQLSRLGEPYFTTKGRKGTGLGMMAAIKIIEAMSGKLSVTSKENEGTTFTIRFPLVNKSSKAQ